MTKRYTIFALAVLPALFSCTREIIPQMPGRGDAIELFCAVSRPEITLDADTKATTDYKGILESTTKIPDGYNLGVGLVRIDRTKKDYLKYKDIPGQRLDFRAWMTSGSDCNTFSDSLNTYDYSERPHYYYTKGELGGTAEGGLRKIDQFDNAQFYRDKDNVVQYVSWYPYGTVNGNKGKTDEHRQDPFTITETLDLKTDVLYSDIATETMDHEYQDIIKYKHALCQFRIYVYSIAAGDVWGKLENIEVLNESRSLTIKLPDTIEYDYTNTTDFSLSESLPNASISGGDYTYPDIYYVTEENGTPGVELPSGLGQKKRVACYLSAPPKDGLLQLDVHASKAVSEKTITIANEFKAGYAYDVVLCFSDHGIINSEISIGKWEDNIDIETTVTAEMFYDLSRYGTANSYIVSSSNVGYSFNGMVKGCGNTLNGGSIVGLSDEDCKLPANSYIDILYCDPPGLLELRSHSLVDGSVLFYVPGNDGSTPENPDYRLKTKGNAIIAARKGEDDDILWSWHIWVTDRPRDIGNNNGYSIMDRNLGALESHKTKTEIWNAVISETGGWDKNYYGFYYQWGRKDPMIPGWTITGEQNKLVSIEQSIANPNILYGYTYDTRGYDWIAEDQNTNVDKMALWGYKADQDFIKTVYDPCPPGYRVPELKCWTQTSGVDFHTFLDGDFADTQKKAVFNINGIYTWYPAAGWIDTDDPQNDGAPQIVGSPVRVNHSYSSTLEGKIPENNDAYCYVAEQEENSDTQGAGHFGGQVFNGAEISGLTYRLNNADACPVRCISTASQSVVKDLSKAQTSNCYVVPSAGTYKFKADVRGNGTQKVTTSNGSYQVLELPAKIDHAQIHHLAVLWWQGDLSGQTGTGGTYGGSNSAGTDCPIHFVRSEGDVLPRTPARNSTDFTDRDIAVIDAQGYVKFHIDEDQYCHGNALIAAFDSGDKVIWSWHIWLTDNPSKVKFGPRTIHEGEAPNDYTGTYTYYAMDRNLGATYCPTASEITNKSFGTDANAKRLGTFGLYYQWGRKDPIQGPDAITGTTGTTSSRWYLRDVSSGYRWTPKDQIQVAPGVRTRSDAVAVPATFLYKSTTAAMNNWNDTDWTLGANYDQFTAMWGYPAGTDGTTHNPSMTKTMNDPCPPGYYMPPHYFFAAAFLGGTGQDDSSNDWSTYHDFEQTYYDAYRGLFVTDNGDWIVGSPIWFPFAGYRAYETGAITNLGTMGTFHSGLDMGKTRVRIFSLTGSRGSQAILGPGTAASVRCRAY